MSIVFMGTPEWAIPSLKAVIESGIEVSAVFTQPDRRVGRKKALTPSPVKEFALEQNLAVHAPENAGSKDTMELVRAMSPELILVCAYGQILTQEFLDIPDIGCFNLHFSFLPSLRGASPVQTAIASGLKTTGVSLQKIVLRLDSGPLAVCSAEIEILHDDTTPMLGSRLSEVGGNLIRQNMQNILERNFNLTEQNESKATYCGIIKKGDGHVNWKEETAHEIDRKLRAFYPWPGIYSFYKIKSKPESRQRLQFTKAEIVEGNFECGKIYPDMTVGAHKDGLKILSLKPEGKKEMDADSFLRGNSEIMGTVLE
jgi:methionyl-tRNA formyltransferase